MKQKIHDESKVSSLMSPVFQGARFRVSAKNAMPYVGLRENKDGWLDIVGGSFGEEWGL